MRAVSLGQALNTARALGRLRSKHSMLVMLTEPGRLCSAENPAVRAALGEPRVAELVVAVLLRAGAHVGDPKATIGECPFCGPAPAGAVPDRGLS